MARLRVIDVEIPDSQVQTVLNTFFPGAAPGPVMDAPLALPAAADPAPPAPNPRVAAPRVTRKARRKIHVPTAPPTATAKPMGVGDRIMLSLPGTLERIAQRAGKTKSSTSGALSYLRKCGKVVLEGGVWSRAGAAAAAQVVPAAPPTPTARHKAGPKPTIKAPPIAAPVSSTPVPPEPPKTTRELFRECLESGPHNQHELIQFARTQGKSPSELQAGEILTTMARAGEAVYRDDGRWAAGGKA